MTSTFSTKIEWHLRTPTFDYEQFNREYTFVFDSGIQIPGSSAPDYFGNPSFVDPEEMFLGSIAACHMLTFLAIAAKKRLRVIRYTDKAQGKLEKNSDGRLCFQQIELHPNVIFASAEDTPSHDQLERMHDKAHAACFIANSVACDVTVAAQRMFVDSENDAHDPTLAQVIGQRAEQNNPE